MNEPTNWSWIRQPLRHLPWLVLVGWLAGLWDWLNRSFGWKASVPAAQQRPKRWPLGLAEPSGEDAAWRLAQPATGKLDRLGRKKRAMFLFSEKKCINFHFAAAKASLLEASWLANPPWGLSSRLAR